MRTVVAFGLVVVTGHLLPAQSSSKDAAAWTGIMFTPAGAFPLVRTWPTANDTRDSARLTAGGFVWTPGSPHAVDAEQLIFHGSTWKSGGSDVRNTSVGVTYLTHPSSRIRYGGTIGWMEPTGGGGVFLVGLEALDDIWQGGAVTTVGSSFTLGWNATGGLGHISSGVGGTVWSAVLQLPLKWRYQSSSRSSLAAFVAPGFGLAGTTDAGSVEAETGTRPMIGFGGGWTSARGIGLHVGTHMVPLDLGPGSESSPWVLALALSVPIGGDKP